MQVSYDICVCVHAITAKCSAINILCTKYVYAYISMLIIMPNIWRRVYAISKVTYVYSIYIYLVIQKLIICECRP